MARRQADTGIGWKRLGGGMKRSFQMKDLDKRRMPIFVPSVV
jgi:hypothetical protein